jgi:hypothetical protein
MVLRLADSEHLPGLAVTRNHIGLAGVLDRSRSLNVKMYDPSACGGCKAQVGFESTSGTNIALARSRCASVNGGFRLLLNRQLKAIDDFLARSRRGELQH